MEVVITRETDESRLRMLRSVWSQLLAAPEEDTSPSTEELGEEWGAAA